MNSLLKQASSAEDVLHLTRQHGARFDTVHTATALHRLAVLVRQRQARAAAVRAHTEFRFLQELVSANAHLLGAQALSNSTWALAIITPEASRQLLEQLAEAAGAIAAEFSPQQLSSLLWAFAALDFVPSPARLEDLASRATDILCFPEEVCASSTSSMCCWG